MHLNQARITAKRVLPVSMRTGLGQVGARSAKLGATCQRTGMYWNPTMTDKDCLLCGRGSSFAGQTTNCTQCGEGKVYKFVASSEAYGDYGSCDCSVGRFRYATGQCEDCQVVGIKTKWVKFLQAV